MFKIENRHLQLALCLCLLPFLPGIIGPFMLDDLNNLELVFNVQNRDMWWNAVTGGESGFLGRPLAAWSFLLNFLAFGKFPLSFKLVNILIHALNAGLVFVFVKQLLMLLKPRQSSDQNMLLALLCAALWTVHPMQVSTVLYVVQRMTLLTSTFMLIALILACRFLAGPDKSLRNSLATIAKITIISTLGLLHKETAILVPVLIFIIAMTDNRPAIAEQLKGNLRFIMLACILPMSIYAALSVYFWPAITAGYVNRDFTLSQRLATEPLVLLEYLRNMAWPDIRHMGLYLDDFPIASLGDIASTAAIFLIGALASAAVILRRRYPLPAFAILWFLGCHLLESTVLNLELAFEHRNYLALLGPALMAAAALMRLCAFNPKHALLAGLALTSALGGVSYTRARTWSDEGRFLEYEARNHPGSIKVWNNKAEYHFRNGEKAALIESTGILAERFPTNFFAQSQQVILIQCRLVEDKVDWHNMRSAALSRPSDPWFSSSLLSLATNYNKDPCNAIPAEQLHSFFDDLLVEYRRLGLDRSSETTLMAKARLYNRTGDEINYISTLEQAASESEHGNTADLELLGYYLSRQDLAKANALILRLKPGLKRGREIQNYQTLQGVYEKVEN